MIQRTEFQVAVTGAELAQRQFEAVAAAEKHAGDAAVPASRQMDTMGASTARAAESAGGFGRSVDKLLGPLRTMANILPGLGLSGIILAGWEAGSWALGKLAEKMDITAFSAKGLADSGRILNADLVAQKLQVEDVSDAMDRYAKSIGLAGQAQLTFLEKQQALQAIARGDVKSNEKLEKDAEKALRKIREMQADLDALNTRPGSYREEHIQAITEAGGETAYRAKLEADLAYWKQQSEDLNRYQLGNLGRRGAAPVLEAVADFGRGVVAKAKVVVSTTKSALEQQAADYAAAFERYRAEAAKRPGAKTGGRIRATEDKDVSEDEIYSMIYGGKAGPAYKQPVPQSDYEALGNLGRASQSVNKPTEEIKQQFDALKNISTGWRETLTGMASDASNAAGLVASAMGQMAQAVGNHLTNLIVAGEFGAKSLKKEIGNILAGISAQAFGYAVLLEAMAIAAHFAPFAGLPAAAGLAAAGAVMAGAGVALGVTARVLGADPIGGRGGHSSGGGGGSSGGGGSAPYNGFRQSGQDTHVTVIIGGEVVTRGVTAETRRLERRGGITEPRLQRAGAGA